MSNMSVCKEPSFFDFFADVAASSASLLADAIAEEGMSLIVALQDQEIGLLS